MELSKRSEKNILILENMANLSALIATIDLQNDKMI
jgi:hypothetical protein